MVPAFEITIAIGLGNNCSSISEKNCDGIRDNNYFAL
jgi:hypothetical protein